MQRGRCITHRERQPFQGTGVVGRKNAHASQPRGPLTANGHGKSAPFTGMDITERHIRHPVSSHGFPEPSGH